MKTPKVPQVRQHRGNGQDYIRYKGRQIYLGRTGTAAARAAYASVVGDILSGRPPVRPSDETSPPELLTLRELGDRYLAHASQYYVKNGEQTSEFVNIQQAVAVAVGQFGDAPAESFGPLAFEKVLLAMVERGLARTTINSRRSKLIGMFKWAVSRELIAPNVHVALTAVPGLKVGRSAAREPTPVEPVSDEVVDKTLPHLPPVVADMVKFQRLTGCRPGEARMIRPCDIDKTGEVWSYRPSSHKTQHRGKDRVVPLGPKAQDLIAPYLEGRGQETFLFRPCDSEAWRRRLAHAARTTPMPCGTRPGSKVREAPLRTPGEFYRKDSYNNAIRRACVKAGVKHWTPHQIRHTYATAVRRNHGLEAAQVVLGHRKASVTETYAERDYAKATEIARQVG